MTTVLLLQLLVGYQIKAISASIHPTGSNLGVDINAAISMFESEQLGEVIARPQLLCGPAQALYSKWDRIFPY